MSSKEIDEIGNWIETIPFENKPPNEKPLAFEEECDEKYNESIDSKEVKEWCYYDDYFKHFCQSYTTIGQSVKSVRINIFNREYVGKCLLFEEFAKFRVIYTNFIKKRIQEKQFTTVPSNHYQILSNEYVLYLDIDYTGTKDLNLALMKKYKSLWFEYLNNNSYIYDYYVFVPETTPSNKQGAHILVFLNKPLTKQTRINVYNDIINNIDFENKEKVFDVIPIKSCSILLPFAEKVGAKRRYKLIEHKITNLLSYPCFDIIKLGTKLIKSQTSSNNVFERAFRLLNEKYFEVGWEEANKLCLSLSCLNYSLVDYFYDKYISVLHTTPTEKQSFETLVSKYENNSLWGFCNKLKLLTDSENIAEQEKNIKEIKFIIYRETFESKKYSLLDYQNDYLNRQLSDYNMFAYLYRFIASLTTGDFIIHINQEETIPISRLELKNRLSRYRFKGVGVYDLFVKYNEQFAPIYENLKIFGNMSATKRNLQYYPKYKFIEPENYNMYVKDVQKWLELISTTFENQEDFKLVMQREHFRLNNSDQPSQCMFAMYGEKGGEGKGLLSNMICKLYYETKPSLREKDFQREQLKKVYTSQYCYIDEGASDTSVLMKNLDAIKIIWNTTATTRAMYTDTESVEIACDIDYLTNNYLLNDLFKNPEMFRRVVPIKRIRSTDSNFDTKWMYEMLKDEEFNSSMKKYIKENDEFFNYYIGYVEKYNKNNKYALDLQKVYTSEDIDINCSQYETTKIQLKNNSIYEVIHKDQLLNLIRDQVGENVKISLKKYVIQNLNSKFRILSYYKPNASKAETFKFIDSDTVSYEWNSYYVIL